MENTEEKKIIVFNKSKLLCFQWRFNGNTYEQIEGLLKQKKGIKHYAAATLESYFAKGGEWREDYDKWVEVKKDDISEQITGMFVAQANLASQTLTNILMEEKAQPKDRIAAAKEILDRGGFAAIQRVKSESETESVAEQILKGMELQKLATQKAAK